MSKYQGGMISSVANTPNSTAYTGKANGIWSLPHHIVVKNAANWAIGVKPPTAPTLNTVTAGDTKLTVAFTAPTTLNGETVLSYTAYASPGNFSVTGTTSPLQITGLTNNTSYTITVVANTNSGSSVVSNSLSKSPIAATAPGAPNITNVTSAAASGTATATITFSIPASDGGSAILDYTVTASPGGLTATGAASPLQITGLGDSTSYTFTATARNIVGSSSASTGFNHTTVAVPPTTIGQSWRGGYYAGILCAGGGGTPTHYLVIADATVGRFTNMVWFTNNTTFLGVSNRVNGPTNTTTMATSSANYQLAYSCENLTAGGYTDWYMPAVDELQIIYTNLKPSTDVNDITVGGNGYSYPARGSNYTTTIPGQTTATAFRTGGAQAFDISNPYAIGTVRSSTESTAAYNYDVRFGDGSVVAGNSKTDNNKCTCAIRRVAYF